MHKVAPFLNRSLRLGKGDFCFSSCLTPGEAPAKAAMSQSGHSYILCRGPSGQEQFSLPRPGGSGFCRIFLAYSQRPQQASTASKAMSQSGHSYIFLTCSQIPQQVSTSSNAEPKWSLVYFPCLQSKTFFH